MQLGTELHDLVRRRDVADHLRTRHQLGALARYGARRTDETRSQRSVFDDYKMNANNQLGIFVVTAKNDTTLGLATLNPAARLARLRLPLLPARLVPSFLHQDKSDVASTGPRLKAWLNPSLGTESAEVLSYTYKALMQPDGPAHRFYEHYAQLHELPLSTIRPWTTEPVESPLWVKDAITSSGLLATEEDGRYYDGESDLVAPPQARLYRAA